jgi:hypothetical protein
VNKFLSRRLRLNRSESPRGDSEPGHFAGGPIPARAGEPDLQTKFFANCLHGGVAKPRAEAILAMVQQIFDAPVVELSLLGD